MFKKKYLLGLSILLILFSIRTGAYCLFTDYKTATFYAGCERLPVENPDPFTITYHANGGIFPALSNAGLYETGTNTRTKTWEELVQEKLVTVSESKITSFSTSISGDLIIPEGITAIGNYAAENHTSLTGITLPSTLTSIGYMSFRGASNLTMVKILEGTKALTFDTSSFHNCRNLSTIFLPKNLTTVGTYSFYNCKNIANVYFSGTKEEWALISFASGTSTLTEAPITYNYILEDASSKESEINCITYENLIPSSGTYREPVRENHVFIGWYTDPECSNRNQFFPDKDLIYVSESFTVYAKWSSLIYDVVHKSVSGIILDTDVISGSLNTSINLSPNQYLGYASPKSQQVLFDSTDPKTIVFLYTPIEYTLSLHPEGGTLESTELSYNIESNLTLPVPQKDGYVFRGWYTSNDFSKDPVASVSNSMEDKSFYAKWSENSYPFLTVSTLPETTFESNLCIAGTVRDNTEVSSLLLNGLSISVDSDGNFNEPLNLQPGDNPIELIATDIYGNSSFYKTQIHLHTGSEGLSYANGCYITPQVTASYCPGHTWANYSWSCGRCGSYISTGPTAPSVADCPNHNVCAQDKGVVPHLISSGTNYCSSSDSCSSWITNYVYLLGCNAASYPEFIVNIPKSSYDQAPYISGTILNNIETASVKINGKDVALNENGDFQYSLALTKLINEIDVTVTKNEVNTLSIKEKILLEASPGLYASNSTTLLKSWDSLIAEKLLTIEDDTLTACEWTLAGDLQISKEIAHIGASAFEYAASLNNIILPDGVLTIGNNAFSHCEKVTHIILPNSITKIGSGAFYMCRYLKEFSVPSGISTLGNLSFYYCSELSKIHLPDTVTSIGNNAFNSCTNLKSVYYQGSKDSWSRISIGSGNDALTSANIYYQHVRR